MISGYEVISVSEEGLVLVVVVRFEPSREEKKFAFSKEDLKASPNAADFVKAAINKSIYAEDELDDLVSMVASLKGTVRPVDAKPVEANGVKED